MVILIGKLVSIILITGLTLELYFPFEIAEVRCQSLRERICVITDIQANHGVPANTRGWFETQTDKLGVLEW